MHFSLPQPRRLALSLTAFGLAALGLAALAPTMARAQTQDLFVSNTGDSTILRYAGTGPGTFSKTTTTLSGVGLSLPQGLAFDARGDLFAANANGGPNSFGTITEFAAGAAPGTFGATSLLSDPKGTLYEPGGLAFDARGNLFAANTGANTITEFAAGATPGVLGPGTVALTGGGMSFPVGLAFDAQGNLFAANLYGGADQSGSITEFASTGSGTFGAGAVVLTGGLSEPAGLAFDARGDLFVANISGGPNDAGTITEFAAGAAPGTFGAPSTLSAPSGTLNGPLGLAFDAQGDLFTANARTITEFAFTAGAGTAPGTFGAGVVVETGLNNPSFLAFGPSAPVPEASTTASLGLLLLLGLGGVVVAARKKRRA